MGLLKSIFNVLRFNKKNWRAVTLCVLAATIFWFLNALNKNYTTSINFPLEFDYDPRYYVAVKPVPEEIQINVTGMGWDLFRRSTRFRTMPLVIPLERPSEVKKIVGSTLPALFSNQLQTLQINFVVNDTVYIDFQPKERRWLSITIDSVEQYLRHDYHIMGNIDIDPDSIFIEGPSKLVTALKEPYAIRLPQRNIDNDYAEEVEVRFSDGELILRRPAHVNIQFDVEKFVNVSDTVSLELVNLPPAAQPKLLMDRVGATLYMQESMVNTFPWDSLKAVVDLKDFRRGKIKLIPDVKGLPDQVTLIQVDTVHITY